jgi:hypothetical protein
MILCQHPVKELISDPRLPEFQIMRLMLTGPYVGEDGQEDSVPII